MELAGWLSCRERASHLAVLVCCRKNICDVFSFSQGIYVSILNLIASALGPSILTFDTLHSFSYVKTKT